MFARLFTQISRIPSVFTLALLYPLMIESAFALVCSVSFKTGNFKTCLDVSVNSAPDDSRAIGLNDIDFPKEFSYV